ncbi:hypothetical protein PSECIP111854_01870 [Pseudoalteromonas sp. CIP111854]|uniref:Prepilin-type N-terminal cleavage/methylation domain-containing protein n=1 Tax=Pseudoalteromonas holothuriae TaxID=2963714 RepID=A0A9W4VR01_9GAMM|nr:type II secretion system protein [Pseudoalteromonas sp. CIP111854]CAH9056817.1 hypothetical protein PSECIP111854_01870 [Pseudoalteromonas sp. CIP111854]
MKHINGFTLIELMIVMMIVALLTSLVGPLAFESLSRSQAKSEVMEVKRVLASASQKAFLLGEKLEIELSGSEIKILKVDNVQLLKQMNFELVSFKPQKFEFNSKGLTQRKIVVVNYRNRDSEIDVIELITGSKQDIVKSRGNNE